MKTPLLKEKPGEIDNISIPAHPPFRKAAEHLPNAYILNLALVCALLQTVILGVTTWLI